MSFIYKNIYILKNEYYKPKIVIPNFGLKNFFYHDQNEVVLILQSLKTIVSNFERTKINFFLQKPNQNHSILLIIIMGSLG